MSNNSLLQAIKTKQTNIRSNSTMKVKANCVKCVKVK